MCFDFRSIHAKIRSKFFFLPLSTTPYNSKMRSMLYTYITIWIDSIIESFICENKEKNVHVWTEQNKWCVWVCMCLCEFETRDNNFINLKFILKCWRMYPLLSTQSVAHSTHKSNTHAYVYFGGIYFVKVKIRQKWNMNAIKSKKHICFTWNCVEHVLYVISVEIEFVIRPLSTQNRFSDVNGKLINSKSPSFSAIYRERPTV